MSHFSVEESEQFIKDVEEAAVWILISNIEQSEYLAEKKVDEFNKEINSLKSRLEIYPESGEAELLEGIRKFPLYDGRYSAKWLVDYIHERVILLSVADSKYPKALREVYLDDEFSE